MSRLLTALVLLIAGCPVVGAGDEVVARTDRWSITESEVEEWSEVLRYQKGYKILADRPNEASRWLAEEVAVSRLALEDYGSLVSAAERDVIWRQLQASTEWRWWVREVVQPQVMVGEDEARLVFENHRDGYRKAPGVVVREVFLWAPVDLEDLRLEKRGLADRLHAEIGDADAFSAAASQFSDATSRLVGGRIGTVLRNQIPDALARHLFGGDLGLTDVIVSRDGFYLFWVSGFRPPKDNSFSDVADRIKAKLELRHLDELKVAANLELKRRYGLEVESVPEMRRLGVACRMKGKVIELDEVLLEHRRLDDDQLTAVVGELCSAELIRRELERLGSCPAADSVVRFEAEVARRILDRLASAESGPSDGGDEKPVAAGSQYVELWTFEVLEVPAKGQPRLFYELLRIEYDLGGNPELDEIQAELVRRLGVEATISSHESVTEHQAAGLGPEIHRTLKKRLRPGETSTPLVLPGGNPIMVVRQLDRETVEMTAPQVAEALEENRRRQALNDVRHRLLDTAGFRIE